MFVAIVSSKDPPWVSTNINRKTLLIIDDDPPVRRMLVRFLSCDFDEVLVAATPVEAEQILLSHEVTHLISDYDLGAGYLNGTELIVMWRQRFRTIERALLLTGCSLNEVEIPAAVDRYFLKGVDPKHLRKALRPD